MIGYRVGDILVTEAGVPAAPEMQSGRVYVDITGSRNASIVMTNLHDSVAVIDYSFADTNGSMVGHGSLTLDPNRRISEYLSNAPFNVPAPFQGTFAFTSSIPLSVATLRTVINERNEPLISSLPLASPDESSNETRILPQIVSGGDFLTEIVLTNPGTTALQGTVQFYGQGTMSASPMQLLIDGTVRSAFDYEIPPFGTVRKLLGNPSAGVQVGSARIIPSIGTAPAAFETLINRRNNITIAEATFAASPSSTAMRLYVESSSEFGQPGSVETGISIANPSPNPLVVTIDVSDLNGVYAALSSVVLPGNGQISNFASVIAGLPAEFKGVMRLTADSPFSALSIRTRVNERGDFLIAPTPASYENAGTGNAASIAFPLTVQGGGYFTEFILYNGTPGGSSIGDLLPIDDPSQPQ